MDQNNKKKKELPPSLCDSRTEPILDHHRIHHYRMVLSGYRTHRTYLYDWPSTDLHLARPFLVWQCVSTRESV